MITAADSKYSGTISISPRASRTEIAAFAAQLGHVVLHQARDDGRTKDLVFYQAVGHVLRVCVGARWPLLAHGSLFAHQSLLTHQSLFADRSLFSHWSLRTFGAAQFIGVVFDQHRRDELAEAVVHHQ